MACYQRFTLPGPNLRRFPLTRRSSHLTAKSSHKGIAVAPLACLNAAGVAPQKSSRTGNLDAEVVPIEIRRRIDREHRSRGGREGSVKMVATVCTIVDVDRVRAIGILIRDLDRDFAA